MNNNLTIKDIQGFVNDIMKDISEDSLLYEDFKWFSTNKYTVPSEYIGELLLFISKIKDNSDVCEHKDKLSLLEKELESYFE